MWRYYNCYAFIKTWFLQKSFVMPLRYSTKCLSFSISLILYYFTKSIHSLFRNYDIIIVFVEIISCIGMVASNVSIFVVLLLLRFFWYFNQKWTKGDLFITFLPCFSFCFRLKFVKHTWYIVIVLHSVLHFKQHIHILQLI